MIVRCLLDNSFHPYPYKNCKLNALYFKYAKTMLQIYCLYGRRMTKLSKNAHEPGARAPRFWPVGREQKSRRSSLLTVISRHGRERTRTDGRTEGRVLARRSNRRRRRRRTHFLRTRAEEDRSELSYRSSGGDANSASCATPIVALIRSPI